MSVDPSPSEDPLDHAFMAPEQRTPLDLARLMLAIISILGLLLMSLWILSPFFTAIIWALMIVVACWPLQRHRPNSRNSGSPSSTGSATSR